MRALIFAFVISILPAMSFAQAEPWLHQYEFDVINVVFPREDYDHFTKIALGKLKESGRIDSCVDLRRDLILPTNYQVTDNNGVKRKVSTNVRFLLREALTSKEVIDLADAFCANEPVGCEVIGFKVSHPLSNINLQFTYRTNSMFDAIPKLKSKSQPLPKLEKFPRFSSSCESGSSADSVLFTGRSHEAQALIKLSPVKLEKIVRVELALKTKKPFYNFGRPDIWWTGHPTTEEDQELAPEDILKDLH